MDLDAARPSPDQPLLVYSLAEFREVIFGALDAIGARTVVEIGNEHGLFTEPLLDWLRSRGGRAVTVDPAPGPRVRELAEGGEDLELLETTSHVALERLDAMDAYLLDGDHNYFTVAGELDSIATTCAKAAQPPLIVLQDIGWPTGRRDMYYDPESIPADSRHPYSYEGVVPWSQQLVSTGGFRSNGAFAYAVFEGGPRNGVCTALEDFLGAHPEYRAMALPCIFGLALVFPSDAPWAAKLDAVAARYDGDPLLARMESNRIRLYLEVLRLNDDLSAERRTRAALVAGLEQRIDGLMTSISIAEELARRERMSRERAEAELEEHRRREVRSAPAQTGLRGVLGGLVGGTRRQAKV